MMTAVRGGRSLWSKQNAATTRGRNVRTATGGAGAGAAPAPAPAAHRRRPERRATGEARDQPRPEPTLERETQAEPEPRVLRGSGRIGEASLARTPTQGMASELASVERPARTTPALAERSPQGAAEVQASRPGQLAVTLTGHARRRSRGDAARRPWPNSDAIPWVGVLAKLASPILPTEPAQYTGLWLCLCFALQGWFGRGCRALPPVARRSGRRRCAAGAGAGAAPAPAPPVAVRTFLPLVVAGVLLRPERAPAADGGHHTRRWRWGSTLPRRHVPGDPRRRAARGRLGPSLAPARRAGAARRALALLVGVAALLGYFASPAATWWARVSAATTPSFTRSSIPRGCRGGSGIEPSRRAARGLTGTSAGVLVLVATAAVVEVVAIVRRRPPLPWRRVAPL